MRLDLKTWAIIGLALIIVLMILFRKPAERTDLTPYKVEIALANRTIDSLSKGGAKLARKIAEDSILQAEEKQVFQKSITGLQARLKEKRVRIDSIILDRPEVKEFISMQDSVISQQAGRINTLENVLTALRVDIKSLNRNFDLAMEAQVQKYDALESINKLNEKALKKKTRGVKVWKAATVLGTVGAFILGSGL
jgi:chromosome segregation ATPase